MREDQQYLEACEKLYFWCNNRTGCFTDMLFDIFCKADANNTMKLAMGFPNEYSAYRDWKKAVSEETFFSNRGFGA